MTEPDPRVHRALSADSRVRLLQALTAADRPLGARELADEAALHLTTVRAHLDVLIEAGLVESEPERRTSPGRPRVLYRASSQQPPAATGDYRLVAEVLASHLAGTASDPAEKAQAAGHAWGRYLVDGPPPFADLSADEARAKVVELFAALGFDPQLAEEGDRIFVRRCPFVDLARRHPEVACSMHLGLLRGALETLGAPLTAERIDPLVEPSLCVAHLEGDLAR